MPGAQHPCDIIIPPHGRTRALYLPLMRLSLIGLTLKVGQRIRVILESEVERSFYCVKIMPHGSNGEILRSHIPDDMPHGSNGEFYVGNFHVIFPTNRQSVQMENFHDVKFPTTCHTVEMRIFYMGNFHVIFPTKYHSVQMGNLHDISFPTTCHMI